MISVIVVSHNNRHHLGRCLESVGPSSHEVILVDNASTDGSVDLVRERFPEVVVLPQDRNLGFAAANNLAAARATGERYLLINADAWLAPGALDLMVEALHGDTKVGLVAPSLSYPDGSRQFTWSPARGVLGEALQKVLNPLEASPTAHGWVARSLARVVGPRWFTAACVLVRAEAWHAVGGFDDGYFMYFEDVDFCVRLEQKGWRLVQERRARVQHVGGSNRRDRDDDIYRPAQIRYYRLHRPAWESRYLERRLRRRFGDEALRRWQAMGDGQ
jgi:GT2 family glycosyltransferase